MIYLVVAGGVIAVVAVAWALMTAYRKNNRKRGFSWRRSEYYMRFTSQLDHEEKTHFLALPEYEQYKAYMDWSFRVGLQSGERSSIVE